RFPAAAAGLLVGVHKLEALVQTFTHEVDFSAVDVAHAFGVDEDLHTVLFEQQVFRPRLVNVFHFVGQARATGRLDAQAQADTLAAFFEIAGDMARGPFADGDAVHAHALCL